MGNKSLWFHVDPKKNLSVRITAILEIWPEFKLYHFLLNSSLTYLLTIITSYCLSVHNSFQPIHLLNQNCEVNKGDKKGKPNKQQRHSTSPEWKCIILVRKLTKWIFLLDSKPSGQRPGLQLYDEVQMVFRRNKYMCICKSFKWGCDTQPFSLCVGNLFVCLFSQSQGLS